jgi:hypothetical protein
MCQNVRISLIRTADQARGKVRGVKWGYAHCGIVALAKMEPRRGRPFREEANHTFPLSLLNSDFLCLRFRRQKTDDGVHAYFPTDHIGGVHLAIKSKLCLVRRCWSMLW